MEAGFVGTGGREPAPPPGKKEKRQNRQNVMRKLARAARQTPGCSPAPRDRQIPFTDNNGGEAARNGKAAYGGAGCPARGGSPRAFAMRGGMS
jgi:hypothetical protein